ncbi:MAG: MFS transporter [Candidatus Bathyarchaeota archaeon]|nr:MFS transporter [Candidatus Bathyarchaeota archaeon]MDH5688489.1 MFS transporter [Candidatus Bathyarchaeota archaeon]
MQGQSRNYYVLLMRGVVATFLSRLVMDFNNLYIIALGASPFQLSTVQALGSAADALVSVPAGWLSDTYSLKKIMIFGMLVQALSVAFYAFAQSWEWIIVAMILASLTMALVFRVQMILVVNSLPSGSRATGLGMRTTIIEAFSILAPTIGGVLIYYFGGISVEGIRPLYYIQLIGITVISIYVSLQLEDKRTSVATHIRSFLGQYNDMLRTGVGMKRFVLLQTLGSITWGMLMPFPMVYVAEFKGADSLTIGYMGTCMVLVSMFLAVPMGSLSDRKGRKLTVFVTRPFMYGCYLLLILAPEGAPLLLLIAWSMRGVMMASNAWTTITIEMAPPEYRGRWIGFTAFFQNLMRVPAMILGGYLYESVDPTLVFIIPILVDAILRMPILATIPETLKNKATE